MSTVRLEREGALAHVILDRPAQLNAISPELLRDLDHACAAVEGDAGVRALALTAAGRAFCAGADLSVVQELAPDPERWRGFMDLWHRVFDRIQYSRVPVIAALKGAVIGGGLELACAAHIRVAEPSAYFALPEGQRGIFVGGGGSVRLPRLIGVARMTDMMLTGRVYSATEGSAYGFAQYLTEPDEGLSKAMELAGRIASNAPLTNFAVLQALPMIAEANPQAGLLMESLMATVAQSDKEAKARIRAFLEHKTAKVKPS